METLKLIEWADAHMAESRNFFLPARTCRRNCCDFITLSSISSRLCSCFGCTNVNFTLPASLDTANMDIDELLLSRIIWGSNLPIISLKPFALGNPTFYGLDSSAHRAYIVFTWNTIWHMRRMFSKVGGSVYGTICGEWITVDDKTSYILPFIELHLLLVLRWTNLQST